MSCGSSGPKEYQVSGTVTYDGQPVTNGRILMRNTGGDKRGYSAEIIDGKYQMKCEAGNMRVEITGSRIIPGKMQKDENGEMVPVGEMYIPVKYNTESTLTATVKPESQTIPFDLKK